METLLFGIKMTPTPSSGFLRTTLVLFLATSGFCALFFMYYKSSSSPKCHLLPAPLDRSSKKDELVENTALVTKQANTSVDDKQTNKLILLLWFWPENYRFHLSDCKKYFDIDGCHLTDDRSLYTKAEGVLIFHKSISRDLSNLPPSPRPAFQKWIWMNVESPTNTYKLPGIENLFNLTLSYRQDADIPVRWQLTTRKVTGEELVLPKKERLVCWIVSNNDPNTGTGTRYNYYKELSKHIKVDVFGKAFSSFLGYGDYFPTIASCKFYLAFENSIHKDYITEKLNGPLAVGTVPVVLGPPRQNYENFFPGDSFIHVNDFPDAKALADFLKQLDKDVEAYRRYFQWRKFLSAKRHLIEKNQEFIQAICFACDHVGLHKEYRATHNLYKWFFSE